VTELTAVVTQAGYLGARAMEARTMPGTEHMPKPNDEPIAGDRESAALNRVAARVEELPALPAEAEDFGWEASVLEKLRLRLNDIE